MIFVSFIILTNGSLLKSASFSFQGGNHKSTPLKKQQPMQLTRSSWNCSSSLPIKSVDFKKQLGVHQSVVELDANQKYDWDEPLGLYKPCKQWDKLAASNLNRYRMSRRNCSFTTHKTTSLHAITVQPFTKIKLLTTSPSTSLLGCRCTSLFPYRIIAHTKQQMVRLSHPFHHQK